jgi:hypothetical protein
VFFGTPHCGGNKATTGKHVANILSVVTGEPRNSLLATLERSSLYSEAITDDFNTQLSAYEVVSFFESKKMYMRIGGLKLIPRISMVRKTPPN